ncbi:MAG TPA: BACON domain-containing protein, partial [Niastella sp.]
MKTRFILCLLSSFVLILSCKKDGNSETDGNGNKNTEPVDSIFVSRTNLQLGMAINAIDTFSIKSNIQWAATVTPAAASWLKIDKNNGVAGTTVVTITALLNNETGTTRTATISITANNNQPITITITQKPFPTYIGWQKVIGGFYTEKARSAAKTSDGGYLIAGYSYGNNTGDITGSHGVEDAVIVKVDANGNKQWVKSYGGSNADEANAIAATSDGNFVVVGYTRSSDGDLSSPRNLDDLWIMKIDGNGTILWSKTYGSSRNDKANAVIVTSDGGLVVAGSTNGYDGDVPGNHSGNFEFWILKLDASGNKLWSKTYGGASTEEAYSITACTDGGFAITGRTASIDGDVTGNHKEYSDDVWVVKVDANGNKLWAKCFGGLDQEWGNSIKSTPDGGL